APATATGTSTTTAGTSTTTARTTATRWTAAIRLGTGFVDVQGAAAQFLAIEGGNRLLGFGGVCHFDERKAAGTAGIAIGHDADLLDRPMGFEQRPQLCFSGAVGDVANKQLLHIVPRAAH